MIVIVDYGVGNSGSVLNMVLKAGGTAVVSDDPEVISRGDSFILPGVGSFDKGISNLLNSECFPALKTMVLKNKRPLLGICLGMQMLFDSSEEGSLPGLGWIRGSVKKFRLSDFPMLKVPHMGWNLVRSVNHNPLLPLDVSDNRFYFVHSFHVVCLDERNVISRTHYGYDFSSAVQHENIFGVQFHPEKSHRFGLELIKKFIEYQHA